MGRGEPTLALESREAGLRLHFRRSQTVNNGVLRCQSSGAL
jgi:hypothetical protein